MIPSLDKLRLMIDSVNSFFYQPLTQSLAAAIELRRMGTGTGPFVRFGGWLRKQRLAAKLRSQPQAKLQADLLKLKHVTQGKLSYIERGWNTNPDPNLLSDLAILYRIPLPLILEKWTETRHGKSSGNAGEDVRDVVAPRPSDFALSVAEAFDDLSPERQSLVVDLLRSYGKTVRSPFVKPSRRKHSA